MKKYFITCAFLLNVFCLNAMEHIKLIDVQEMPLPSLIRLIAGNNDLNIVPSIKASKINISTYLKNIDPVTALEEICSSHNLWLKKDPKKNIYRIYSLEEYKKSLLLAKIIC